MKNLHWHVCNICLLLALVHGWLEDWIWVLLWVVLAMLNTWAYKTCYKKENDNG